MIRFRVPGRPVPLPRTTRRKQWTDPAWARYLGWRDAVAWSAKVAGVRPMEGEVEFAAVVRMPDRRRADADNILKGLLDALNGVAWRDDSQVTRLTMEVVRGAGVAEAGADIVIMRREGTG